MPHDNAVMIAKSSMMDLYQDNFDGVVNYMSSKIVEIFPPWTNDKD